MAEKIRAHWGVKTSSGKVISGRQYLAGQRTSSGGGRAAPPPAGYSAKEQADLESRGYVQEQKGDQVRYVNPATGQWTAYKSASTTQSARETGATEVGISKAAPTFAELAEKAIEAKKASTAAPISRASKTFGELAKAVTPVERKAAVVSPYGTEPSQAELETAPPDRDLIEEEEIMTRAAPRFETAAMRTARIRQQIAEAEKQPGFLTAPSPRPKGLAGLEYDLRRYSETISQSAPTEGSFQADIGELKQIGIGVGLGVVGFGRAITEPVRTVKGISYAITNPAEVGASIGKELQFNPSLFIGETIGTLGAGKAVGAGIKAGAQQAIKVSNAGVRTGEISQLNVKDLTLSRVDLEAAYKVKGIGTKDVLADLSAEIVTKKTPKGKQFYGAGVVSGDIMSASKKSLASIKGELVTVGEQTSAYTKSLTASVTQVGRNTERAITLGTAERISKDLFKTMAASTKEVGLIKKRLVPKELSVGRIAKVGERETQLGISRQYLLGEMSIGGKTLKKYLNQIKKDFSKGPQIEILEKESARPRVDTKKIMTEIREGTTITKPKTKTVSPMAQELVEVGKGLVKSREVARVTGVTKPAITSTQITTPLVRARSNIRSAIRTSTKSATKQRTRQTQRVSPIQDIRQIQRELQKEIITPKIIQTPLTSSRTRQRLKTPTRQITRTAPTPGITPPVPVITFTPPVPLYIPPRISLGIAGTRRVRRRPRRPSYAPSLIAVLRDIRASAQPKYVTGLGIRPIIKRKKKRKVTTRSGKKRRKR